MIKLSHVLTGTLVAASALFADWATAAPAGFPFMSSRADQMAPLEEQTEQGFELPAKFKRQVVGYSGGEAPGTIVIDTGSTFLYLVQPGGRAIRYGIGVGRDGFRWSGTQAITKKAEWPDWTPPAEMIARQPYLPRFMAGGETNPLGARAMYLGSTIYRIHGTNAPSTIGTRVSSGCIRLTNDDVADLYSRVTIGTKVIVLNTADHRVEAPTSRPLVSAPVSLSTTRY
jgi:lipoprotein-anchoring transpeptidase ErfK/SrfK